MAEYRTKKKKAKASRAKAAPTAPRLGRAKAWELLENLWQSSSVLVHQDRLNRDQLHSAVDTNVLLYSLDASEPTKQPIAQELLRSLRDSSDKNILPWQVQCEATAQLRYWTAKKRITANVAMNYIHGFRAIFPIKTPRPKVFDHALELFERFQLSHWDSMQLAACVDAGVTQLYSEDMHHGADIDGVKIINPFKK